MWVDCHRCEGHGHTIENKTKNTTPCELCNKNDSTFIFLIGQIWVKDGYTPITPPSSPRPI